MQKLWISSLLLCVLLFTKSVNLSSVEESDDDEMENESATNEGKAKAVH